MLTRTRRIHCVEFRGAPWYLRVPTFAEECLAEVKAAQWVQDNGGSDAEVDEDLWRVSLATAHLLAMCTVDADGGQCMVPRLLMDRHSSDELVELLHLLNACREAERGAPAVETDEEAAEVAGELAYCESLQAAYRKCAGMDHEAMVRLAYWMSHPT